MNIIKRAEKFLGYSGSLFAAVARFLPHPPNFTPVGAMSIYAGARTIGPASFAAVLFLMLSTDLILSLMHGYPWMSAVTPFVYGSIVLNVLLGRTLRNTENALRIGSLSILASLQFFLVTNIGVWLVSGIYPHSVEGLSLCFTAALPFFQNTLIGDLFYTGAIFTAHHLLAARYFPKEAVA
jgi:hypothetical protein